MIEAPSLIVGIFVGGASRRMGTSKGLLPAPDASGRSLVERLLEEVDTALPQSPRFLVGQRIEYERLSLPVLADAAPDSGPLGGLVALLAEGERTGASRALCVACDHPYLDAALLRRFASEHPEAEICCSEEAGKYQPLVARYRVSLLGRFRSALAEGTLALQPLVRSSKTACLELNESERRKLVDWDTPQDVTSSQKGKASD